MLCLSYHNAKVLSLKHMISLKHKPHSGQSQTNRITSNSGKNLCDSTTERYLGYERVALGAPGGIDGKYDDGIRG